MGRANLVRASAVVRKTVDGPILPYFIASSIILLGVGAWYASLKLGTTDVHGLVIGALERAPLLLTVTLGVAAGVAVRLMQHSRRVRRELDRFNRELAESNHKLAVEVQHVRESEERFRLLFSSNPHPMWLYDCDTLGFVDVNDAAVEQYGYSRDEFLAMKATEIRPLEDVARFVGEISQLPSGYNTRGLWRHRRKDGSLFHADIKVFRFEKDGATRELVLAQDVTERVEAEEALRGSESALQSLVNNAPFGICRTSLKEDRFLTLNQALCQMLGYGREEMLGLQLSTQLYADANDRERMREIVQRNRTLQAFETSLVRRDGETVRVRAWGVLKPNLQGELDNLDVYIEDVTEQSTLEQQVRRVQKLEAVGRLAGGIAHDFNNILVVIKLSTELMLAQITPESPMSKPLLQVANAADRAAALTKQLLAFGRQQVMQARVINVNTVVTDTSHLLRRIIGEDIQLVTKLNEQLHNARLDSDQLGQVILNLAVNARDAMPEGGTLHIETDNVELDETYTTVHTPAQPGHYVMVAVSDTGCGIDKVVLPRIFDPFFTTKPVGKGTGLGLSIVYGIVKQSGGSTRRSCPRPSTPAAHSPQPA